MRVSCRDLSRHKCTIFLYLCLSFQIPPYLILLFLFRTINVFLSLSLSSLSHDTSFTHTTWKHPRLLNTCGLRWHYLTLKRLSRTTLNAFSSAPAARPLSALTCACKLCLKPHGHGQAPRRVSSPSTGRLTPYDGTGDSPDLHSYLPHSLTFVYLHFQATLLSSFLFFDCVLAHLFCSF